MSLAQDGFTPLHFCSQAGCAEGCRLLLGAGAEVDAKLLKTKKVRPKPKDRGEEVSRGVWGYEDGIAGAAVLLVQQCSDVRGGVQAFPVRCWRSFRRNRFVSFSFHPLLHVSATGVLLGCVLGVSFLFGCFVAAFSCLVRPPGCWCSRSPLDRVVCFVRSAGSMAEGLPR